MSFSGTIKELISEVWQLYTGKILSDDDLKTGPADGLKLILDQSSCHWQIEPLSLLSQQNEVYGLPQWAVVLYSGDHSFPWNTIIDYSFDSVINFSNHFNGIYGKSFTSITGGSVNLYVDLGQSNVLNTSNSSTLISNSNNSTEISHNGRDVGGKRGRWQLSNNVFVTENVTIPSDKDINWRLRKICSLTEKRLYYMIFPLIIPSQTEIASFLVQRELLIKGSLGDDSTQFLDSSMSTPQSLYNVTVPNSNKHEAIGSPPISSMKSSGSLDNGISSKNQFDGSVNSMSPPDSRCSINAQYGSLPSEKSVSSSSCSSSFNKVSAENLNILRRSNSQPSLSPFTEPLSSACISSPILQSKSIKLNASLVAMDVDNISEHHPSLSYLQSNDIPMESNTTFNELNTSQRLCQFEEFCKPDSRVSANTRLTVEEFKEKAGEYLNLDAEFLNVSVEPDGGYISKDFTTLSSTDSLRISLSPCISLEEVYLSFYVLDLEGEPKEEDGEKQQQTMDTATYELNHTNLKRSSPIWSHQINLLYRLGWSVEQLLKCASSVFKRIHNLNIPLSQLRLRKCGLPDLTPGPIFSETDVLTTFTNQHQGLMLQLISEKHTHNIVSTAIDNYSDTSNPISYNNKPRTCSLFLRQWHPSSYSFDAWHELILTYHPVTSTRWDMLVKWLVQHTGLNSDRLEVAQYKFPGAIHSLNICPPNNRLQWLSCSQYPDTLLSFTSGNMVFFRDTKEESKTLEPSELQKMNQSEISRLEAMTSPWSSQGIPVPQSVWDGEYATWSEDPVTFSCEPSSSSGGGCEMYKSNSQFCGPYLPQSHEPSTAYSFSTSSRIREQPLRIYTAEDVPSSSSTIHTAKRDKHPSTGPSSPKFTRTRDSRTP
ncbi:unnamed protein product [Heterobilharzia americana]|nr:unnamed protein product [Heterobilharzia americana]